MVFFINLYFDFVTKYPLIFWLYDAEPNPKLQSLVCKSIFISEYSTELISTKPECEAVKNRVGQVMNMGVSAKLLCKISGQFHSITRAV